MPIIYDTDNASGWRSQQTLNTGNLPSTIQQLSGAVTRQWGIKVTKVELHTNGTTVAGAVTIADPNDSTVLYTYNVPAGATAGIINTQDFWGRLSEWRDFKVTGLTATVTKVLIFYRM